MILHALTVCHWRNIGCLELTDLDHPLVVLHGPNRTGKSSLVAALRCCLLDFDHDSTATPITSSIPWHTRKTPEITVEFESGGTRYRLVKKFSKRSDGDALLERLSGPSGWTTLHRGKEAGREVRTLLKADESTDGLNQLLWFAQGEPNFEPIRRLNATLEKRLQQVLGTLLTDSDWEFAEVLQRQSARWLTGALAIKKNSRIADLQKRRDECAAQVAALDRARAQGESLVQEHDALREQIVEDRKSLAASERELPQLQQEQKAAQERRRDHDAARHHYDAARAECDRARQALSGYEGRKKNLVELARQIRAAEPESAALEERRNGIAQELKAADEAARQIRADIEQLQPQRDELADRAKLIELARQRDAAARTVEQYDRWQQDLSKLRGELAGIAAPQERELTALRDNRRRAVQLKAQIDADALRLDIDPETAATLRLAVDASGPVDVELAPGRHESRQIRQRAELTVPGLGTIRITRGRDDRNLDEAARELQRLESDYADALGGYGLSPADENAADELLRRQTRRQSLSSQIRATEGQLKDIAPAGRESLAADLERCDRQRQTLLERRPGLAAWTPDAADLDSRQRELDQTFRALVNRQQETEALVAQKRSQRDQADRAVQVLRDSLVKMQASREAGEMELERAGDEISLKEACRAADKQLQQAEQRRCETVLTEEERTIEDRLDVARAALQRRQERLNEHENRAHALRGELRGLEGLHEKLAAAEAELEHVTEQLNDEQLDAEAHRLLRQLFDECRAQRVQRTTGPIETQVLAWAKRLGLDEYGQLEFGKGYLPEGLRRPETDAAVAMNDKSFGESYGTLEQLALLIRLAVGRLVADGERHLTILDDPLTHADSHKHRRMLDILQEAAAGPKTGDSGTAAAPLQILIFTCHPDRFDHLHAARQINLTDLIRRA